MNFSAMWSEYDVFRLFPKVCPHMAGVPDLPRARSRLISHKSVARQAVIFGRDQAYIKLQLLRYLSV